MADIVDKQTRSRMMAGIRGRNTRPEVALRSCLHRSGFRFRIHSRDLPGRPDIVLPRFRAAVFVHGCFWHRHSGCRFATVPATRPEFWAAKFAGNVERDSRARKDLLDAGWRVGIVWECSLKQHGVGFVADRLISWLTSPGKLIELDEKGPNDPRRDRDMETTG